MKIKTLLFFRGAIIAVLLLSASAAQSSARVRELTQAQAIARVKAILRDNAGGCRITKTLSVSSVRVKAGWRVTARIKMSASGGASSTETAVWIVGIKNRVSAQNQLTSEIANGCP